jgi:hypothetical protein
MNEQQLLWWLLQELKEIRSQVQPVLVSYACNPSYSGGRDQEDCCLKPAQENSSPELILKNPSQKRACGMAQVVDCLPSRHEALGTNPITAKKKKKKRSQVQCSSSCMGG